MLSNSSFSLPLNAAGDGEFKQQMTSVHPYLAWSDGEVACGAAGYGTGKLEYQQDDESKSTSTRLLSLSWVDVVKSISDDINRGALPASDCAY